METTIWLNGKYTTINPKAPVNTTKAIHSFCVHNGLSDRLFRSQGGWYKLGNDGRLYFVARCLYLISFEDLYNELTKV